jgi:thiol-disulfide isomerase/thioredoxin
MKGESAVIKKLEILANIAVIITSVVLCSVVVKKYFFSPTKQEASVEAAASKSPASNVSQRRSILVGTKISLAGIDWSKSNRTVVLALSTGCHFCSESAPFYQELQQQKRDDVRLVALFPQPVEESRAYLNRLGIGINDIVQSPLSSVGASGTPTLLLIDNRGAVVDSWVGKLTDVASEQVRARVSK